MSGRSALDVYADGGAWWRTSISEIKKNQILIRGYPIEQLIGTLTYSQMMYLLLCGEILSKKKALLLEWVLVAGADHGPRAPSIAAARMAATCGISFNSAVATGINLLGDAHGGAAEKAMKLFYKTKLLMEQSGMDLQQASRTNLDDLLSRKEKLPGFGHQLHDDDPRVRRLYALAREMIDEGEIGGLFLDMAEQFRIGLQEKKNVKMTMNIDGVAAALQCELNIPAEAAKGIFALSRGMGIVAHACEEAAGGVLIKGPCPNDPGLVQYQGHAPRNLDTEHMQ